MKQLIAVEKVKIAWININFIVFSVEKETFLKFPKIDKSWPEQRLIKTIIGESERLKFKVNNVPGLKSIAEIEFQIPIAKKQ